MSERWTDKKRGYADGIPSGAQALSFTADQRERLGELSQLRLYGASGNGDFGVKRFGKYERGFSSEEKIKWKTMTTLFATAFFDLDKIVLQLIRPKKNGYDVINECSVTWALEHHVQMANVNIAWDTLKNKYHIFINWADAIYSPDCTWSANYQIARYEVDLLGNAVASPTTYNVGGVSRNKIDVVFLQKNKRIPVYYFTCDNQYMLLNANMELVKDGYIKTRSITDGDRRIFTLGKDDKTYIYNNYSGVTQRVAIEDIKTETQASNFIIPLGWGGTNLNNFEAGIQIKDKYYYPAEYYNTTADWRQMICESDINNLSVWREIVSFKMDRHWVSEWREKYPRVLNYSSALNILFAGITEIQKQKTGETVTAGQQKSYINAYSLSGELLYTIPLSDWEELDNPANYWFDYTEWGLRATHLNPEYIKPNLREIRTNIVEYSIDTQ